MFYDNEDTKNPTIDRSLKKLFGAKVDYHEYFP